MPSRAIARDLTSLKGLTSELRLPDRRLRITQFRELRQRIPPRVLFAEKFIELRRLDVGTGEHRVRLPAVMDLGLGEGGEQPRDGLGQDALAALGGDRRLEVCLGEGPACVA